MSYKDIVPYTSVFLDAQWSHFIRAAALCTIASPNRDQVIKDIQKLWTSDENQNHVLPCLSVRTALDLYLRVMKFPPGSEVIMSAVNIPDMVKVVHSHDLKIVSLDVDIETMAPKIQLLERLITEKTKLLLLANIFGRRYNVKPFLMIANRYNIAVVEDWAESFSGLNYAGDPESDLVLFSFGPIKYYTSFGGAIAKVRDKAVFESMENLYEAYSVQTHAEYLTKVLKYAFVYLFLNCPRIIKPSVYLAHTLNIDHKVYAVKMLRGFPDKLIEKLRHRPSTALLAMMRARMSTFDVAEINVANIKAEYVSERIPACIVQVGNKAEIRNHWLFPIIVENPEEVVKALNDLGVDAYRGATQLNVMEPDDVDAHLTHLDAFVSSYPHEAKYLIDHVIYLPVNKTVPFRELDRICSALSSAVMVTSGAVLLPVHTNPNMKLQAKI